ncbi:holo-ACP synthase [Acetobacter sp. AN02]|uniref:holo-ACP synthase n=1 Tax=Acetobacter sp. AN02 TaxID=2894186 RepID=UPI00243417A0|nr:holo-ACP synthase [Acetobacter sp. AN02]MDG6095379.1 holo-ACP synthase [Acetobacter sp. AN02]
MLIGTGMDLCDIRRIEKAIGRHGERFLTRVFTEAERQHAERRSGAARTGTYAKRWAAKEACAKALGTGFSQGVFHSSMGVKNLPSGQPTLILTGGAARRLQALTPAGMTLRIHLSLTDDMPYALAQVMIEALPDS